MTHDVLLSLRDLVVGYPGRALSSPMSLQIPPGARVGVIGANGSGKTTFIKTLLGLVPPLEGSCSWREGTTFGYVPQENQIDPLFPLTIEDLLKMGMTERLPRWRASDGDFEEAATRMLAELGMTSGRDQLVRELSGGQRQRALIARPRQPAPGPPDGRAVQLSRLRFSSQTAGDVPGLAGEAFLFALFGRTRPEPGGESSRLDRSFGTQQDDLREGIGDFDERVPERGLRGGPAYS